MKRLVLAVALFLTAGPTSAAVMTATVEGRFGQNFSDTGHFGLDAPAPFEPFKLVYLYDTANVVRLPAVVQERDGGVAYLESETLASDAPNPFLSVTLSVNGRNYVFAPELPGIGLNETGYFVLSMGLVSPDRQTEISIFGGDYPFRGWYGEVPFKSFTQPNSWTAAPYCQLSCGLLRISDGAGDTYGTIDSFTLTVDFAPVPEPRTWALLVLGFGVLGGVLRRRSGQALA